MSRVYLIPNHHEFENPKQRIELTEEMLSWPIVWKYNPNGQVAELTYKNALKALLKLGQFDVILCLEVNQEEKIFNPPHRCWGSILLDDQSVIGFSHDTRYDNKPFVTLTEWPEIEYEAVLCWTTQKWKRFFIKRIKSNTLDLQRSAEANVKKTNMELAQQQKETDAIMLALEKI